MKVELLLEIINDGNTHLLLPSKAETLFGGTNNVEDIVKRDYCTVVAFSKNCNVVASLKVLDKLVKLGKLVSLLFLTT